MPLASRHYENGPAGRTLVEEYDNDFSLVLLRPGDVLLGGLIVETVNGCVAKCMPLATKKVAVTFHKGCHDEKTVVKTDYGRMTTFPCRVSREMLVERR